MFVLLTLFQVADPLAVAVDDVRPDQDVLHYHIEVSLPDEGAAIRGATTIYYVTVGGAGPFQLDFDDVFTIDSIVPQGGTATSGSVQNGLLQIDHWGGVGDTLAVTVYYRGTPGDGLFIQDNVHGERTAFADNWPNRARHWFPSEDHPSDKATASFAVEAPAAWKVIANGDLAGVDRLSDDRVRWRWRTRTEVPTYTMVVGAGPMTIARLGDAGGAIQELWTFAPDSAFAQDGPFARVHEMMAVYRRIVGPFSYAKLAHVQSSTRFGGMENSSAIFYTERGYARRTMGEGVVAHETAHQWFGDAVTARDWHHLWLSEGFASYFGPLFLQQVGDEAGFRAALAGAKDRYFASDDVQRPVIDTSETDLFALLNRNNYQKGAWILHMLRGTVGDSAFFGGVREYYATFRDSTALSSDLLAVMQRHTHKPLRRFFEQWLLQPGYPQVEVRWTHHPDEGAVVIELQQVQSREWGTFALDVPVRLEFGDRHTDAVATFTGEARTARVRIEGVSGRPSGVTLDAAGDWLLTTVSEGN